LNADAEDAVDLENCPVDPAQIVRPDQPVPVGQPDRHRRDAGAVDGFAESALRTAHEFREVVARFRLADGVELRLDRLGVELFDGGVV